MHKQMQTRVNCSYQNGYFVSDIERMSVLLKKPLEKNTSKENLHHCVRLKRILVSQIGLCICIEDNCVNT